jgi:membrane-anchored protein YejM (alkaline phosphatase superfamily)
MKFFASVIIVFFISTLLACSIFTSCDSVEYATPINTKKYKANKVIIIVIDGPRYSESFGDASKQNMPAMWQLAKEGTLCTNFYNNGTTFTMNGMSAITTGVYSTLPNNGSTSPIQENIFQKFTFKNNAETTYLISSKDKLQALANCQNNEFANKYLPITNCGVNGLGTGYRSDSITQQIALNTLKNQKPKLAMITYMEPDASGHLGNFNAYLNGIKTTAQYTKEIYDYLQSDSFYKNQTTVFITNDHGRHLDNTAGGFAGHGDGCEGCKHISLLALGPDVPKNKINTNAYESIDIPFTICHILGLPITNLKGKLLHDMVIGQ